MKKSILVFLPLLLTSLFISHSSSATTRGISVVSKHGENLYLYKDYQALVVGVSNYERWPKLPNAAADAMEVADRLDKMGVQIKLVLNPSYRELKTALTEMIYVMGREENRGILFYYAGHGETETLADGTKMGYIIPKDCPLLRVNPMGFANHAVSMKEIESASMRIRSKHVLMLFDSCFSGALFALVRAVPHDITEKSTLPVRQFITAGREDEEVPDQSMFKRCLLIGLEGDADLTGDGYITGSELGMYLSDKVVNYTNRQQHPQYGKINNPDLDRGDFIFSLGRSVVASEPAPSISTTSESLRLAEERAKLERERRELEEMKALIEERKRLIEEGERLKSQKKNYEKENLLLASKPPKEKSRPSVRRVKLRSSPKDLSDSDVRNMIVKNNFYAKSINEGGSFLNDFIHNNDGTITDRAAGLMWEEGCFLPETSFLWAENSVSKLNYTGYLGYKDWRIPTLEELCSLLKASKNERGRYIASVFDVEGNAFWTSDVKGFGYQLSNYSVDFTSGKVECRNATENYDVPGRRQVSMGAVKLVRSVNNPSAEKKTVTSPKTGTADSTKNGIPSKPNEIARHGNFIAYSDGTVLDTKTRLMWAAKDDGKGVMEGALEEYIQNYKVGGYEDWRLPTVDELETLYNPEEKNNKGYHITKFIDIGREWIWASGLLGSVDALSFESGGTAIMQGRDNYLRHYQTVSFEGTSVLPVRSGH